MPLSAVISLQALADARLDQFTGRGVHGFWFNHWRSVDAAFADGLHENTQDAPFTLSPLLGFRRGRGGTNIKAGQAAFFRIGMLTGELSQRFEEKWLGALTPGSEIEIPQSREEAGQVIPGVRWKVTAGALESNQHPMAARAGYEELSRKHLMNPNPPRQWRLEFLSPTAFHAGKTTHLPFPLPESLVNSWMRRWQAFAPIALPHEEVTKWARTSLVVSSYTLRTVPAREADRLRIGCVGSLTLRALDMPPYLRAAMDLLAAYSFFCGSGAHTTQGLGQTRCWNTTDPKGLGDL